MLKNFFSKFFGVIIFFFLLQSRIRFYSDEEDGIFLCGDRVLGVARYCAEVTICNELMSLQIPLGGLGVL